MVKGMKSAHYLGSDTEEDDDDWMELRFNWWRMDLIVPRGEGENLESIQRL